jgi:hypothetical protein
LTFYALIIDLFVWRSWFGLNFGHFGVLRNCLLFRQVKVFTTLAIFIKKHGVPIVDADPVATLHDEGFLCGATVAFIVWKTQ